MSLKERMAQKAGGGTLVKRRDVELPDFGERVSVRGLMFGRSLEVGKAKDDVRALMMLCYSVEDPETHELLWDYDKPKDVQFVRDHLSVDDVLAATTVCDELSGGKKPGKKESSGENTTLDSMKTATTASLSSSLPRESEDEPSQN